MTILIKNWNYMVVLSGTASVMQTGQSVSTVNYPTGNYIGNATPIITGYPIVSETNLAIDIRIASVSEVAFLKDHLYGAVVEPLKTTLFSQRLYENRGTPLYIWEDGNYIAAWYGAGGLGFYVFVGYNSTNHPTQEILI